MTWHRVLTPEETRAASWAVLAARVERAAAEERVVSAGHAAAASLTETLGLSDGVRVVFDDRPMLRYETREEATARAFADPSPGPFGLWSALQWFRRQVFG